MKPLLLHQLEVRYRSPGILSCCLHHDGDDRKQRHTPSAVRRPQDREKVGR
jgi:hypothetical protein